jgi:predicted Zn finger-like uncharacterized protein
MIEIQCTSCQTRYRIDERILPEDTPTFKCSRCGHVFSAEPRQKSSRRANGEGARAGAAGKSTPRSSAAAAEVPPPAAAATGTGAEAAASAPPAEDPVPPPQSSPGSSAAAPAPVRTSDPRPRQTDATSRRAAPEPPMATPPDPPPPPAPPPSAAETLPPTQAKAQAEDPVEDQADHQQAEGPAEVRYGTRDLLQRRFQIYADEADKSGKNLAFDFTDELPSPDSTRNPPASSTSRREAEEKWEVGDTAIPRPQRARPRSRIRISDIEDDVEGDGSLDRSFGRNTVRDRLADRDADQDFDRIRPEEVSAEAHRLEQELRGRPYKLHSAGYFLGLFAMVVLGFGVLTIVIQSAPTASAGLLSALPIVGNGLEPPISAAQRVALGQVQAQYAKLKGDQAALVITGTVENLTSTPLGAVQIEAALTASNPQPLRTQAVYCGNSLSSKMIGEMTPHEIEFFEKLDAPRSFTLAPQASAPFVIVFVAPPAGAGHFQLRVVRAQAVAAESAPPAEGG